MVPYFELGGPGVNNAANDTSLSRPLSFPAFYCGRQMKNDGMTDGDSGRTSKWCVQRECSLTFFNLTQIKSFGKGDMIELSVIAISTSLLPHLLL